MKRILLVLALLASTSAFAGQDVDLFMTSAENTDKDLFPAWANYRSYINTNCSRDVSVLELRVFRMSPKFAPVQTSLAATSYPTSQFSIALKSISCTEFIQRNTK